jgi:F-type H+-transporting ATPase subunit b
MEHFPTFTAILLQVVGFGVLYLLLSTYFFGPVGQVLKDREKLVKDRLDEAEANRQKMVTVREEYEKKIAQIEAEARDKIQEATREAHQAREEILAQAREAHDKMLEKGRQELESERTKMQKVLKDHVVDLSITAAGRLIERNLDGDTNRRLIEEVLREAKV